MIGLVVAFAFKTAAKLADLFLEGWAGVFGFRLLGDEIALDVEVANLSSGVAKVFQQGESFIAWPGSELDLGEDGEELQLGLNASSGGAEMMDHLLARLRKSLEYSCFESSS